MGKHTNDQPADGVEALLPCPFCGGEARIVESADTGEKYGGPHFIARCPSIVGEFVTGCLGNFTNLWDMTPEDATARWNRRTLAASKADSAQGDEYKAGWIQCARWASRDDLIADIGSPAYEADRAAALWPTPTDAARVRDAEDARRYRGLKEKDLFDPESQSVELSYAFSRYTGSMLDAAIDAALAAVEGGKA